MVMSIHHCMSRHSPNHLRGSDGGGGDADISARCEVVTVGLVSDGVALHILIRRVGPVSKLAGALTCSVQSPRGFWTNASTRSMH